MKQTELLATELKEKEIEILQDRVNKNSELINTLCNKLVNDYCKSLNDYVKFIQTILQDTKNPPTAQELDDFVLNLPVLLYFCGEAQENLGIKTDVAKSIKQEKYNEIYKEVSGTIADKTAKSELAAQAETITHIIYDRAYKIVKEKMTAAYELLSSCKKVISRRLAEYQMTGVADERFNNK